MNLTFQEELRTSKLPLDEILRKHGLNLKIALHKPKKGGIIKKRDSSLLNIGGSERGFQIYKYINGGNKYYGRYYSLEDAQTVRDKLIECDWDKTQLPVILEETGIKRKIRCCTWYTLWNSSHVQYNKNKYHRRFRVKIHGRAVNCGCFHDPVSCEIVYELIKEALD